MHKVFNNYLHSISISINRSSSIMLNHQIQYAFQLNYINHKKIYDINIAKCNKYLLHKFLSDLDFIKRINELKRKILLIDITYKDKNYLLKIIQKSGYINYFVFFESYFKGQKYKVSNFYLNPIIKKVNIINYKDLYISKSFLYKQIFHLVGMPINYIQIKNRLQNVHKWYINKGFKWVKIYYSYDTSNNQITIYIHEGKLNHIIFFYPLSNKQKKDTIISQFIKKELDLVYGHILNIYQLELHIHKLKEQKLFFFYKILYKI